jgi:uncharacterized protein (TIGR02996 family)
MSNVYELPEWSGFLAAIRAAPDDDLPRLVAADWLEEHGEVDRAEFIRVQCELARRPKCLESGHSCERCADLRRIERRWVAKNRQSIQKMYPPLLVGLLRQWQADDDNPGLLFARGFIDRVSGPLADLAGVLCGRCVWRRSLAGRLAASERPQDSGALTESLVGLYPPCVDCDGTGQTPGVLRGLVRREPVQVVEATDCEPLDNAGVGTYFGEQPGPATEWFWLRQASTGRISWEIPSEIFDCLETDTFASPQAAREELGAAILRWAMRPSDIAAVATV